MNLCNACISMVLCKKGQFYILMQSHTVCMHSNLLGKKGQSAGLNCINCFSKSYWKNVCSLSLHIGVFYLKNFNAYKQFGSLSKFQIGTSCATLSICPLLEDDCCLTITDMRREMAVHISHKAGKTTNSSCITTGRDVKSLHMLCSWTTRGRTSKKNYMRASLDFLTQGG